MPEKDIRFGSLTLNRDTIVRLDSEILNDANPEAKPRDDRTKPDNCPASTQSKVTAHCC